MRIFGSHGSTTWQYVDMGRRAWWYLLACLILISLVMTGCSGGSDLFTSNTAPSVTLSASKTTINAGETVTLTWISLKADHVVSSTFGAANVNGSQSVTPTVTTTYTLVVGGDGGEKSASVTVTVNTATPNAVLTASKNTIIAGESVALTWYSTNATHLVSSTFGATTLNGVMSVTPTVTTTYTIVFGGDGGEKSVSVTVTVNTATTAVSLSANKTTITAGESVTLTWSSINATQLVSSTFGASGTSGSMTVGPTETTTYSITVSGPGGSVTDSKTITVNPPVSLMLTASKTTITAGDAVTLTWSSSNANQVVSSNFGATSVNGAKAVTPASTMTYTITVAGPGGQKEDSVTITVIPAVTVSLTASKTTISPGESVILTWTSTNASTVKESNYGATTLNGALSVTPTSTITYTFTVAGPGGEKTATVTVVVPDGGFNVTIN